MRSPSCPRNAATSWPPAIILGCRLFGLVVTSRGSIGPDAAPRDRPIVRIHSGAAPPSGSFASVPYQGTWYWIDDGDYASKRAFTTLPPFFALAEPECSSRRQHLPCHCSEESRSG